MAKMSLMRYSVVRCSVWLGVSAVLIAAWPLVFRQAAQDRGQGTKRPAAASAEARYALVLGNGAYPEAPLRNPVNDARAMAAALRSLGFTVQAGENLTREAMLRALDTFSQVLPRGGVGLFYFAGHGVQIKGENYLVPVDAQISREVEIKARGVALQYVIEEMNEAQTRMNLLILDACRNNPFATGLRSGMNGMGQVLAPSGTLIAFATAPNSTASDGEGANGLYTQELLAALRTPGLLVEQVFKQVRAQVERKSGGAQVPWENSSLKGDFYFLPGVGSAPSTPNAPAETQAAIPASRPPGAEKASVIIVDKRIQVPAIEAWTDTGVQVQPGQYVTVRASGTQLHLGSLGYAGPSGVPQADPRKPLRDCPTGALIAKLKSELICIEAERSFAALSEGRLWLGLNESKVADNRGSFVTKVIVQEFRP
jgi:hypothetical protein